MKKSVFSVLAALGWAALSTAAEPAAVIDNSGLLPKWVDDSQVKLETPGKGATASPDWIKSLILVEINVSTASPDKTLAGMGKVLDHLAETGVNAIWLTPINGHSHYTNNGLHTLNRELTGTDDIPEQWKRVRRFVDEAHRRNIRVFFDVVSWGVNKKAPLYKEKPDWFSGPSQPAWDGWLFDWKNPELCEWFTSRLVDLVLMTGVDGIRCDSSPGYGGYEQYREARRRLLNFGRKTVFLSEHPSERRKVFDFDQLSFMYEGGNSGTRFPCRIFMKENIVDLVKSGAHLGSVDSQLKKDKIVTLNGGKERFYSFPLSCHDNTGPRPAPDLIEFAYQALFSPFIPLWFIGEEWGNPLSTKGWGWHNPVQWELLDREPGRTFYEAVKRMIRIRRQYPEIFEYFPADHREANLCKVRTDHPELLQAYARYRNGKAILIVPNNGENAATFRITIPYREAGIGTKPVVVTDLLGEKPLASGRPETFDATIPAGMLGVYLVSPEK